MEIVSSMSKSIEYIEKNLTSELLLSDIAKIAAYSPFHYQRLFQVLTGYTLYEYIRNRRLSEASKELVASDIKVLDLSLKYMYGSPEAFTRAFKKLLDVTPQQVKKKNVCLRNYPKLNLKITKDEALPLDFKIESKTSFNLIGYKNSFTADEIIRSDEYNNFCKALICDNRLGKLLESQNETTMVTSGSYRLDDFNIYDALVGTFKSNEYDECDSVKVDECKWVVFTGLGPVKDTHHLLWKKIFLEWFPTTSFQHSGKIELEVFPSGDKSSTDYKYEIWIPVKVY